MKAITLILLSVLFFIGFFLNTRLNLICLYVKDYYVHLIVFFIYPIIFYYLTPYFKYKFFVLFIIFTSLTYGVELLQYNFFDRRFSLLDFKASLIGCLYSFFIIGYFKCFSKAVFIKF